MTKIDAHAHLGYWAFPIPKAGTAESLVRMCEKYDMQYCVASATQALTYDMQAGNAEMAEAAERHDPILGYCYCNANFLEQSVAEMDRYLPEGGFVGDREMVLVDDNDPVAFAAAVVGLMRDPVRRARLGAAARAFVRAHYDWRVIVPRLEAVYVHGRQDTTHHSCDAQNPREKTPS